MIRNATPHRPTRPAWTRLACLIALIAPALARAEPASRSVKNNHVTVTAYADAEKLVPGKTATLAVKVVPDEDWHVYWQNPGGTGLPTEVTWSGPRGFTFGPTRYPAPELKHDKTLKEDTFILAGNPVLLTEVRIPDDATGSVTLTAEASWLACRKQCIPGDAKLALTLPVAATGAQTKPANADLFEDARDALPIAPDKTRHIKLATRTDKPKARPGDTFTAIVAVDIAARHHMQSHKPLEDFLIPAVIFPKRTPGLTIGDVAYPEAKIRTDPMLGKMSEYGGKIEFKIPVEIDELDPDDDTHYGNTVAGVLQYQICSDEGTCYPPTWVRFEIPFELEGVPARRRLAAASPIPGAATPAPSADPEQPSAPAQQTDAAPPATPTNLTTAAKRGFTDWLIDVQDYFVSLGFWGVVILALIGGFLLNLMPCVLPVISLKVLSFVRQAKEDRARVFWLGMAYSAGIMLFFATIAGLYYFFGQTWGALFQMPIVVIIVAALVTAFAMSLFGVFAIFTPKVINQLDQKVEGEGYTSAFATGILATFLGAACTAPFLSAALGAATRFEVWQGALIFLFAGVGMALPFVLLAAQPAWLKFVPRPGPWMGTFETLMGFLLLVTVIWLLNPLRGQIGDFGVLLSLFFLLMVSLAVWIKGRIHYDAPPQRKLGGYALVVAVIAVGWLVPFRWVSTIDKLQNQQLAHQELLADGEIYRELKAAGRLDRPADLPPEAIARTEELVHRLEAILARTDELDQRITGICDAIPELTRLNESLERARDNSEPAPIVKNLDWSNGIPWQHYKRERALQDVRAGYTVFVDYTADWCVNCKFNLRTSLDNERVIKVMKDLNVIPYEADYTQKVKEIKEDLKRFNRGGVPMYLVYSPGDPDGPEVLPEILSPDIVINALKKAGPSRVNQVASNDAIARRN